jgi:hypothetical protein
MRSVSMAALLLATASIARAGHIYGTIRENNQPVRRALVVLTCGAERAPDARTDDEGVYRVFAKGTGNCQLVLDPGGRNAPGPLYSYDRPTAYDFDLIREGGRWILRKR